MNVYSPIKKVLSFLLVLCMVLQYAPMTALAVTEDTTEETATEVVDTALAAPASEDDYIGSGTPDGTPPVLHDITLSVTTVTAPGFIEVIMDASDDVSGAMRAEMEFYCQETGKSLYCELRSTCWDDNINGSVPFEDGKLHGTISISQYVVSGNFKINYVWLRDVAGNGVLYSRYETAFPESVKDLQFTVIDEEMPDGAPPVLNSITLGATSVQAPGTIEVTMDASDDVSGVMRAELAFYCQETGKSLYCYPESTYWDDNINGSVPYADGKFHGTIEIDQYVVSGTFKISYVWIRDAAGNEVWYSRDDTAFPDAVKDLQFTVVESGTPDGTPPVLKDVKLAVDTMKAPGFIEVTVDARDDVSGAQFVWIRFYCEETNKSLYCEARSTYWDDNINGSVPFADGKLHGAVNIDQYVVSGNFEVLEVLLRDFAGNEVWYFKEEPAFPDFLKDLQFTVLNAVPDVTTSVSNPEFVEQLGNAGDNAYIVADYSGNAVLSEDAFEAIAGTDKTVDLVSEGVTWRFNGEDITGETKDIDLSVKITKAEEETSAPGQEIQDLLEDSAAVVLKFAENGELPGKATIQVKVDYAMREYLGNGQKLYVYYYNNQTGELELVAQDLTVVNNTYVEFAITHCSYYVLTPFDIRVNDTYLAGDLNGDGIVTDDDVALLLWHTLFPEDFEILGNADFTGDGLVTDDDVAYLLWHTLFPEDFPL